MRSALRRLAVVVLLAVLLIPGVVQARTLTGSWNRAGEILSEAFLNKVWNLLAFWRADSGSAAAPKSGGMLDPAGQPPPPGEAGGTCDSGGMLDPAGNPCRP